MYKSIIYARETITDIIKRLHISNEGKDLLFNVKRKRNNISP